MTQEIKWHRDELAKFKDLEQQTKNELDEKSVELHQLKTQFSVLQAQKDTENKDSKVVLEELRVSGIWKFIIICFKLISYNF